MAQERAEQLPANENEIVSLNTDDLDIQELENRLAATSSWADDGWGGCGCNTCGVFGVGSVRQCTGWQSNSELAGIGVAIVYTATRRTVRLSACRRAGAPNSCGVSRNACTDP